MIGASHLNKVLLCSSPRSGSTFVANLIQSSPEVIFLNEIMTRKRHLLPEFNRVRHSSDGLVLRESYEKDLDRLLKYTLPNAGNLCHRSRWFKTFVFGSLKVASSVTSRIGLRGFERNPFYRFYFVNSLVEPFFKPFLEVQFPKVASCSRLLIKDVHLLRSYRTFRLMYPDSRVVFVIRDPYAQIASQKVHHGQVDAEECGPGDRRREDKASTVHSEQRAHLAAIYGANELIDRFYGESFEETFALFWRLNNDAMVDQMATESPSRFFKLRYEDLVADPESTIRSILDFLDLPFSTNLNRYLGVLGNYRGEQRHGRSTFVSGSSVAQKWRAAISSEQIARITAVLDGSPAMAQFGYHLES
jgi:hypothetical protein